jgi:SAM-dependent methyltransferase
MKLRNYARRLRDWTQFQLFRVQALFSKGEEFECPVCGYRGQFMTLETVTGPRKHAKCPRCGARERHRLQYLAINQVLKGRDTTAQRMLHFAPEPFLKKFFSERFGQYETADLMMDDVDHRVDMQSLPFGDASFDFIFASCVLDFIPDDARAIRELRRVLRPNGIAILPVSLACEKTIEYTEPNPVEANQLRACGWDYFERYQKCFSRVDEISSGAFPDKHQTFIYEDRSQWPNKNCPQRSPMPGHKHPDVVPVCYV